MFWLIRIASSISRLSLDILCPTGATLALTCRQEVPAVIEKDAKRIAIKIAGNYCGIILKRDFSPTLITHRGHRFHLLSFGVN
jgi:hypothetical protein